MATANSGFNPAVIRDTTAGITILRIIQLQHC